MLVTVEFWAATGQRQREWLAGDVVPPAPAAWALDLTTVTVDKQPGMEWDERAMTYVMPSVPLVARTVTGISFLRDRVGFAAVTECMRRVGTDPMLAAFVLFVQKAEPIDLDDPATVQGVSYLVALGILSDADATRILAPPGV